MLVGVLPIQSGFTQFEHNTTRARSRHERVMRSMQSRLGRDEVGWVHSPGKQPVRRKRVGSSLAAAPSLSTDMNSCVFGSMVPEKVSSA